MKTPTILAFVMAGGEGIRLRPFTTELPKPALPFGGEYRIIDFVLSNLYNSGIRQVYVLTQFRPQPLLAHIGRNWAVLPDEPRGFVAPVLPPTSPGAAPFQGTADAVRQCFDLVNKHAPDLVAVFAADHVYRMDIRQMIDFHETCGAETTVAAIPVPVERASSFGIIGADHERRIREFREKPQQPTSMPGNPHVAYASMGNYVFRPAVLKQALKEAEQRGEHDFGRHVLPRLIHTHRVYAYDFATNQVPGVAPHEEPAYWRDVGNIETYVEAHRDVIGPTPRFSLDNHHWPILSSAAGHDRQSMRSRADNSILGPGSIAAGAVVRRSVLQRNVRLEPGARVDNCIIMDGVTVRRGARLRDTLVGCKNTIGEGTRIGYDRHRDREFFFVTSFGTVVIPPRGEGSELTRVSAV